MRKLLLSLALLLGVTGAWAESVTRYVPGNRVLTLEAGKQYFIGVATYYGPGNPQSSMNLLHNVNGVLTESDLLPSSSLTDNSYVFTIAEKGDNNTYCITNNAGGYLQPNNLDATSAKTSLVIAQYNSVKGDVTCGNDVDAIDENGEKILYKDINDETHIFTVYAAGTKTGWRFINLLTTGRPTPFAFYEAKEYDHSELLTTDENNPKYLLIQNVRCNHYVYYNGDARSLGMSPYLLDENTKFYLTASESDETETLPAGTLKVKIHNAATGNLCVSPSSWNESGTDWYIQWSANTSNSGYVISNKVSYENDNSTSWNNAGGHGLQVASWAGNDVGSTWQFVPMDAVNVTNSGPALSTETDIHLYNIKNVRSSKYATYLRAGNAITQTADVQIGSYWYFVADEDATPVDGWTTCKVYNAADGQSLANPETGAFANQTYYIKLFQETESGYFGYVLTKTPSNANARDAWNDKNQTSVCNYSYNDPGSVWWFEVSSKTPAALKTEATNTVNTAKASIKLYDFADYYKFDKEAIDVAKTAADAVDVSTVESAIQGALTLPLQVTAIEATELQNQTTPAAGSIIQLMNRNYGTYLKGNETNATLVNDASDRATYWYVEAGSQEGTVKLKNAVTGKYISEIKNSTTVPMVEETSSHDIIFEHNTQSYLTFKDGEPASGTDQNYIYGHVNGTLMGWNTFANATFWGIAELSMEEAEAVLQDAVTMCDEYNGTQSKEVGKYIYTDDLTAMLSEAKDLLQDASTEIMTYLEKAEELIAAFATGKTINQPTPGFYRLQCQDGGRYLTANKSGSVLAMDNTAGINEAAVSIVYYDGTGLILYTAGQYLKGDSKFLYEVGNTSIGTVTFQQATNGAVGYYNICQNEVGTRWIYGANAALDKGNGLNTAAGYNWSVQPVTWLPVPVSTEAGWGTLYSPVSLNISYDRITPYVGTVSEDGNSMKLTELTEGVPANEAVVFKYNSAAEDQSTGTYVYLQISNNDFALPEETVNDLKGTYAKTYVAPENGYDAYVLSKQDGSMGMYKANLNKLEGTAFQNNQFKAYLPVAKSENAARFLMFNFDGTETGIDGIEAAETDADANAPVYDLTGRRVQKIQKGLYIIGNKVVIK